jgi:TonB family protein
MQSRPLQITHLVVRILLAICSSVALTLGAASRTRAKNQPGGQVLGDIKPPAQEPPAEVQALANRLAYFISTSCPKKVLVLDFKGPDKSWSPFSAWMGDQFLVALERAGQPLEIMPRSQLTAAISERHLAPKDTFDPKIAEVLAKSLEADVIVTGSFVAIGNGLGIGVTYRTSSRDSWTSPPQTDDARGKIQVIPEIAAQLGAPLDSFRPKDGVYTAGEGGIGYPSCVHCPRAYYTDAATKRNVQGTVVLEAIVNTNGSAAHMKVTKSLESSLDDEAVRAVRTWKLKPATDPDGNAVPVLQRIDVTFHLY